jgi:hypothetical protein|tara:strand:- start:4438 stop:4734 length:297 start_codon:yes stop_codon:yes gene_type:complete
MTKKYPKIFIFWWRYPVISLLLSFIKGVTVGFFVCSLMGCAKYQVVSEVRVNLYHLHNPKKGAEIILTTDTLEVGKWYKLNQIKPLPTEDSYDDSYKK